MKTYIVGGYVRDRLLGREGKDHDFVVVGSTPEEMLDRGFQQVGANFPVFLHPLTGDEFALARTEKKVAAGYNGFETEFGTDVTLEQDLFRRDLTINSMAREVISFNELGHAKLSDEIIDPYGGQADLKHKILRHTSEAFAEDPVRVLRTARFAARYNNFKIAKETIKLMGEICHELNAVPGERIWAEFEKGLMEKEPGNMMRALYDCGALLQPALKVYSMPAIGRLDRIAYVDNTRRKDQTMQYTGVAARILKESTLACRFALVAQNPKKEELEEARIPANVGRVVLTSAKYFDSLAHYLELSKHQRLNVLMELRAITEPRLINDCLYVLTAYEDYIPVIEICTQIGTDCIAIKSVNAEEIAATCKTGIEIRDKLREARLNAM